MKRSMMGVQVPPPPDGSAGQAVLTTPVQLLRTVLNCAQLDLAGPLQIRESRIHLQTAGAAPRTIDHQLFGAPIPRFATLSPDGSTVALLGTPSHTRVTPVVCNWWTWRTEPAGTSACPTSSRHPWASSPATAAASRS